MLLKAKNQDAYDAAARLHCALPLQYPFVEIDELTFHDLDPSQYFTRDEQQQGTS